MDTSETVSVRMAAKDSFFARPEPKATPIDQVRSAAARMAAPVRQALSGRHRMFAGAAALVVVAVIGSSALARVPRSSPTSLSDDPALPVTPASALALEFSSSTTASSVPVSLPSATAPNVGAADLAGSPSRAPGREGAGPTTPTLVVHAAGAVTAPGVYRLADPARVTDVVAAAGGLTAEADPDVLNLAARVGDGERIFVPRRGQAAPGVVVGNAGIGVAGYGSGPTMADPSKGAAGVIDLNTASAEQLDTLPGIGPAIATRIIEQRARIGRFRSVNQLLDVPGIGEAKFATLKSRVKV